MPSLEDIFCCQADGFLLHGLGRDGHRQHQPPSPAQACHNTDPGRKKKKTLLAESDDFRALIPCAQAATHAGARQGCPRAVPSTQGEHRARSCCAFLCPAMRHRCSPPLMRNLKLTRAHFWDRSIICSLLGASLPAWTAGIFICGWPVSCEGHGLGRAERAGDGFPGSLYPSRATTEKSFRG